MKKVAKQATHLTVLTRAFDLSEGDVLEFGTNDYSTILLDWLCSISGRRMTTYESNIVKYNQFKRKQSDYHDVVFIKNWDDIDLDKKHWGLAFIDHDPISRRPADVERLKKKVDYLVIHDTEPRKKNALVLDKIHSLFKHHFDYKKVKPWTTVVSNFYKLSKFE